MKKLLIILFTYSLSYFIHIPKNFSLDPITSLGEQKLVLNLEVEEEGDDYDDESTLASKFLKNRARLPTCSVELALSLVIAAMTKKTNIRYDLPSELKKLITTYYKRGSKVCSTQQAKEHTVNQYYELMFLLDKDIQDSLLENIKLQAMRKISLCRCNVPTQTLYIDNPNKLSIEMNYVVIKEIKIYNCKNTKGIEALDFKNSTIYELSIGLLNKEINEAKWKIQNTFSNADKSVHNLSEDFVKDFCQWGRPSNLFGSLSFTNCNFKWLFLYLEGDPTYNLTSNHLFSQFNLYNTSIKDIVLIGDINYIFNSLKGISNLYKGPNILLAVPSEAKCTMSTACNALCRSYAKCCFLLDDDIFWCCLGVLCTPICMPLHFCSLMLYNREYRQICIATCCKKKNKQDNKLKIL